MAAAFTVDIIDGADFQGRSNGTGFVVYSGTRIAIVRGLTDGSGGQSATALVRARALVAATYPLFTAYDATIPMCYVVGYRSEGLTDDSDGARVRILYDTPVPGSGGGAGTPFVMTDNSETQYLPTQLDPLTGEPLWVGYTDPLNAANVIPPDIATVTLPFKIRRISLDAVMAAADMPTYRSAEGSCNDFEWAPAGEDASDFPRGFWIFDSLRSSTVVGASFYRVHIELATKVAPKEDWSTYAMTKNPFNGRFVADTDAVTDVRAIPYKYGVNADNGILRVGGFIPEDFSVLFAGI